MSNFAPLSAAIVTVLETIQQNGANAFVDIETFPTTNFTGTPAVTVVPSDNESDYATIVQNFRYYVFYIDIYLPIEQSGDGLSVVFNTMLTLADSCLDAFDMSNTLNGTCQILRPVPSAWSVVASNDGTMLTARITLHCGITVNTNNG